MAKPKYKKIDKKCLFCNAPLEAASYKIHNLYVVRCLKCKSDVSGPLGRRDDVEYAMSRLSPKNA